jgi:GR25 family glycosyltransferase involved in LPS biosynthesis
MDTDYNLANKYYNESKYEEAIIIYKKIISSNENNLNNKKYISCLKIHKSLYYLNKEQDGIFYLLESIKYDKKRIECIYLLITYYNIMGLPEVALSFYSIIRDYYENQFIEDYSNICKKLEVDINIYIFFVPYYMIIIASKLNKPEIAIKMFQIIFYFKFTNSGEWWLNNLLHNLNLYIQSIKINKRRFYFNCKEYLNLIKDKPNINTNKINSLLLIIEEYINKEILIRYPIKIINLKRRTDRKEKLLKYLNKENVENYEFIEACDAYALKPTKEIEELFKGNNFGYSKGVIGCAYSHTNLWRKLLEDKNNDFYIIFEDDAELTENFIKKLDMCCEEFINNKMEILYLGAHSYKKRNIDINNLEIIYKNYQTGEDGNGLWAYIISKHAALKIINYIDKNGIKYAIDSSYYINNLSSINYLNETIVGTYFSFADSDIQKHNERFSFN